MLSMIREHDYVHYIKTVEKLRELVRGKESDEVKAILDFFDSAKETVDQKLRDFTNSNQYVLWCLSDDAQEIILFAKSLVDNRCSKADAVNELICTCAQELMYLISIKCAQFYTED